MSNTNASWSALTVTTLFIFPSVLQAQLIRAAFDIGSSTTKMKVYQSRAVDQDSGQKRVFKQLILNDQECEGERKVSYGEDLSDGHNMIREATIQSGIRGLAELKSIAKSCGAEEFAGVATAAFRDAINGVEMAIKLSVDSGIPIVIISQEKEAQIERAAAIGHANLYGDEDICVWGIGGSSMQITCLLPEGETAIYQGQLASISFKNSIIKQQTGGSERRSPNPISWSDYHAAQVIIDQEVDRIRAVVGDDLRGNDVLGLGGVLYYSISGAVDKRHFTADDIRQVFEGKGINKTDEELGNGDYVDTDISNLILVEKMMRNLGISSVQALRVSLTDGIVDDDYWLFLGSQPDS